MLPETDSQAAFLSSSGALADAFNKLSPQLDLLDRTRIEVLGRTHPADDDDWYRSGTGSGIVRSSIRRLSASGSQDAGDILKSLAKKIHPSWEPQLAHAAAEHANKRRDELYAAPSAGQLVSALAGGPPASPADLAAVVLEEVDRYKRTLRTASEMPWKRFWNTDEYGAATRPQIENEDRDRLLELLRTRFDRYGIVATLPEARRGENTRSDMLLLSYAGKNLPIEVKRHYNDELWTAPTTQLTAYASDEDACGLGVYLVFWFGAEFRTPSREDGESPPAGGEELEKLLVADLPLSVRDKLSIVVLDVSRPPDMITAVEKREAAKLTKSVKRKA